MAMHHAAAGEVMKLRPVSNPEAKTIALVKTDSFETIHLVVRAGEHLPSHKVAGTLSLYCIEGTVAIDTADGERRLTAGDWLYLEPGAPHAVRGVADAALILTLLFDRPTLHVASADRPGAENVARGPNDADIVTDLLLEHDHIRSVLEIFNQELERFSEAGDRNYGVLEGSISYCRDYLDQWHHTREDALLVSVLRRQPGSAQALQDIESQHAELARATSRLALIFRDVADRGAIYLREDLVKAGVSLISSYHHHLEWEEIRFFPTAREVLLAEDWEQLSSLPAGPGDPLSAARVEGKYHALLSALSDVQPAGEPN